MVSFRWAHGAEADAASCAAPSLFRVGSAPPSALDLARSRSPDSRATSDLKAALRRAVAELLRGKGRLDESLGNLTVELERPSHADRGGPNAWILFPTYHGERERFNGFCEDKPECECTFHTSARCTM